MRQYSGWLIKWWWAEYVAKKKGAVKVTGAKGGVPRPLGSGERELQNSRSFSISNRVSEVAQILLRFLSQQNSSIGPAP